LPAGSAVGVAFGAALETAATTRSAETELNVLHRIEHPFTLGALYYRG
jgi:hypothetical protein